MGYLLCATEECLWFDRLEFPTEKITAALRMLLLSVCANAMDDYCWTNESTAMECMKRFYVAVWPEFAYCNVRIILFSRLISS